MTKSLEAALQRVANLSDEQQDAIAAQILEALEDEETWERSFRRDRDAFRALAKEALEEHRHGETRPLEELLDE